MFAPTNAAFDALPADVKDVLSKPSNVDLLRKVLEFHVIDGRKYSNQLSDNLLIPSLVQGLGIRVNIYNKASVMSFFIMTLHARIQRGEFEKFT